MSAQRAGYSTTVVVLTPSMRACLRLKAAGYTDAEVALELHRGVSTVKTELGAAYARLGARNGFEAIAVAIRRGEL